MAKVTIDTIEKSFGKTQVLKGVSLDIADGEFVSLVGPSGCGKSTLLRIIAGLETQDAGHITIDEEIVDAKRAADRNLSMVFQSYALYPHLTVAENIAVPLKMRQMSGLQRFPLIGPFMPGASAKSKEISHSVRNAAETLQISHLLERKPGQLSGGQRQRVAVGRALVRNPAAFLLDEPLSNLDAKLRVHTRAEIAQLHRQLGATFIYVTHDQVEAMTMSDRIAVMMDGEILQVGSPTEIYDRPVDIRVAEFIGSPKIAILPADAGIGGEITLFGQFTGVLSDVSSKEVRAGLRPEALKLVNKDPAFKAVVRHTEHLGAESYLHVAIEGVEEPVVLRVSANEARSISISDRIGLIFDPTEMHVFDMNGKRVETRIAEPQKQVVNG